VLFFATATGYAQTIYGSISGTVMDQSGALVPAASVTVRESDTATEYKTLTNGSGAYHVAFLKPGGYTVRFEANGFSLYTTKEVQVVLDRDVKVDAALKLGSNTETVVVSAAATSLNLTNAQVGGQLDTSELIDLPEVIGSKGAQTDLIAKVFPGVSSTSQDYSNHNDTSFGGGRPDTNPIIVDGLPSNQSVDGTGGLLPTPDSTEELQVLTSPFSAQYGQTGGGAVLFSTKAGTDKFHGSLFEYYNSQNLDALGYFTAPGTVITANHFNYYGGSVGGPVLIPRVFDGRKHHLFFFTDWENTSSRSSNSKNTDVPTVAERGGDFSGPTPQGTVNPTIYDPSTTIVTGGTTSRTAFQGNVIPKARLDQVAQNIISFFPLPNCSYGTYNYCVNPPSYSNYFYNADRVDWNATDYDHVWAKFATDGPTSKAVNYIPNAANPSDESGWVDDHYEITWSHIFSPRISNEARAGFVSEENFANPATNNVGSLGLQGVSLTQFPDISTAGLYSLGTGSFSRTRDDHYVLNDALSMQIGQHSISAGGEWMKYAYSQYNPGILSGSYSFTGTFTSLPGKPVTGLADLELGVPATTTISTTNTVFHEDLNYFAAYIQDDYRVKPKLTVSLGLRWEFDGPFTETHNQMYTFNPNLMDPTTGLAGGIEFAGYNGNPHNLIAREYLGFLPRAGLNYHVFRNTVVRGGYGIYEMPSLGFGKEGWTSASTVSATFQSFNGVSPAYQLSQGVPAYTANVGPNGLPNIPSSLTKPTSNVVELMSQPSLAYIQEWQVGVQQDLGHGWIAEVNYEGNHGVHLPGALQINQIHPSKGCCYGVSNAQGLRPYPQFLNVTYYTNGGAQQYAALLAQLSHSWSNGLSLRAAYTWANTLDDVDAAARADAAPNQDVFNIRSQWGTAMINIPQRFVVSSVYSLPFGAGGRFAFHQRVLDEIVGHWRMSGVGQFQVGYPYSITQTNTLGTFSAAQYSTEVGNPNLARPSRTVQKWFNPGAFQITSSDVLGNTPRAALYGPGQEVWDVSLMRDVPVWEHVTFTFRADAHNVFNHPQFDNLNTTITSPAFGSVSGAQDPRELLLVGRLRF
jgi:hypothetical protein